MTAVFNRDGILMRAEKPSACAGGRLTPPTIITTIPATMIFSVWIQLRADSFEAVCDTIWQQPGVLGIEELPADASAHVVPERFHVVEFGTPLAAEFETWLRHDADRTSDRLKVKVSIEAEDESRVRSWCDALRGGHPDIAVTCLEMAAPRDYAAESRQLHIGHCIGNRLWVGPPWIQPPADRIPVIIEPGMAFGAGDHPATQLALEAMEQLQATGLAPNRILDIGTGSGVLIIAAAKLFPRAQLAVTDLDSACAANFHHNGRLNRLDAGRVQSVFGEHARLDHWDDSPAQFGLIVSNILLEPLISLIPHVTRRLDAAGHWIATGLLGASQAGEFLAAAHPRFQCVRTETRTLPAHSLTGPPDQWHGVTLQPCRSNLTPP